MTNKPEDMQMINKKMINRQIVSKINEFLYSAATELSAWLNKILPRVTDEWWQECVIANLTYNQKTIAEEKGYSKLEQFDLAALLRIADRSWYDMRSVAYLPSSQRQCIRALQRVRNNWAHFSGDTFDKDLILQDTDHILNFFENVIITNQYTESIRTFRKAVEESNLSAVYGEVLIVEQNRHERTASVTALSSSEIQEKDRVYLLGSPETKGMVFSISEVSGVKCYKVFVDGESRTFYEGQIVKIDASPTYSWVDLNSFLSTLTAHEINNPSAGNLYSLNAARIDFVPYQFRPALKMIKSDEPRILIADSVGVGKTIEAGIIIKELEARNELNNILIICPKPLIAERKWELEMKRFDEDFVPLDGQQLRQILSDTHRDEEWPARYNKVIIPYSILDSRVYYGEERKRGKDYGLINLDPAPHFDLVIIDEAHQLRNGSMDKDKAFAYKCVHYFCEHSNAVVMLTATPLQTKDDDLYTLLNLLRPDVIMDKEVFSIMSRPNEYISLSSRAVRGAAEGWQEVAAESLKKVTTTQWGENIIAKNPLFADILQRLKCTEISRDERVKLISDIESLHSFHTVLNRTRRKDIQDFCVRRSHTVETKFTSVQSELHDELLRFEYEALSTMHHISAIPFMMATIKRQAASCIFGLAPHIKDIINGKFAKMADDPEVEEDAFNLGEEVTSSIKQLAEHVIQLAENLPGEDPKFDSLIQIVKKKQEEENNKIIIFSTFRHTLDYIGKKLCTLGYRIAQINGSVRDEARQDYRERFEKDKSEPDALDILLFTEVGSEGLDYQFCDTLINYDLPWNPMRVEQRIGRIDRRGQKSEAVNIFNLITTDTVDADIYSRCLERIGVFRKSIGECEEVLGAIGSKVEKIALTTRLSPDERRKQLEQMADNEIRRMQELSRLEDEGKALFGFSLSDYTTSKEIRDAESPWLSPQNIQILVERYLNARLGSEQYILGAGDLKYLRLKREARQKLLEDFRSLSHIRSGLKRRWEQYLKGDEPSSKLTFLPETASRERKAFFITPTHPLVKQAAKYFATNETTHIHLEYCSDEIPAGDYPFSIYVWNYVGIQSAFKVVPVCENMAVSEELLNIIQDAKCSTSPHSVDQDIWAALEPLHLAMWQKEKEQYFSNVQSMANYKLESIRSNYSNRKRNLEQKIKDSTDERIIRMRESELQAATEKYNYRVVEIDECIKRADIHTTLIAHGIIDIRKG